MKSLPDPIPYPCFWNTLPVERTIRSPRHSQLYKAVRAWERGYPGGVFWNAAMPALCKQTQATYVVICCWVLAGTMVGALSWMNEGILETAPTSSMMNMQHIYIWGALHCLDALSKDGSCKVYTFSIVAIISWQLASFQGLQSQLTRWKAW